MLNISLCGGGHSHLFVLSELARLKRSDISAKLVSPSRYQTYSGMVPGWMAGFYQADECRIDLAALAGAAGAELILSRLETIDTRNKTCVLDSGETLKWDILSLDTGSQTRTGGLERLGEIFLPVKPLENFQKQWLQVLEDARQLSGYQLLVAGGGAAGVEIAMAAASAFRNLGLQAKVSLASSPASLMSGHADAVRNKVWAGLAESGVALIPFRLEVDDKGRMSAGDVCVEADKVIGTTGAAAPDYLQGSGLTLDGDGYLLVSQTQQSLSHPDVFGAGDVTAGILGNVERSGVHAVRAGPVLAHNIIAWADGKPLKHYLPRKTSLYLIATGDGRAIMSWGPWAATGKWVWWWKDRIDRKFISRFSPQGRQL